MDQKLTVVKAHELLERQGVMLPQRTLHRYAWRCLDVGRSARKATVRVADGEPGSELLRGRPSSRSGSRPTACATPAPR